MLKSLWDALQGAVLLLITLDPETYQIIGLSLYVSLSASVLAALFGIPMGLFLSYRDFWCKNLVLRFVYMFMSTPPVIAGLFVFLIFSRNGPWGSLAWLYTSKTMIIAQFLLVLPIIIGQIYGYSHENIHRFLSIGKTLGAGPVQRLFLLCRELRGAIFLTFALGFGRAMSEVGAVMLVGGNIKGKTRVMTTSITTLMGQGKYELSLAFALILLFLSFLIQSIVYHYHRKH